MAQQCSFVLLFQKPLNKYILHTEELEPTEEQQRSLHVIIWFANW